MFVWGFTLFITSKHHFLSYRNFRELTAMFLSLLFENISPRLKHPDLSIKLNPSITSSVWTHHRQTTKLHGTHVTHHRPLVVKLQMARGKWWIKYLNTVYSIHTHTHTCLQVRCFNDWSSQIGGFLLQIISLSVDWRDPDPESTWKLTTFPIILLVCCSSLCCC